MRLHFISRLALLVGAGFLVVASQVWSGDTLEWLFIAGGIVMIAAAAIDAEALGRAQRALDGVIALLGAWSIVQRWRRGPPPPGRAPTFRLCRSWPAPSWPASRPPRPGAARRR
jgi:hypothetical protein